MKSIDLSGLWRCEIPGQSGDIHLPGTLDQGGIGFSDTVAAPWHPDEHVNEALSGGDVIATRFTRRFTYEGAARLTRRVKTDIPAGKRVLFECGRARWLGLSVNGKSAPETEAPTLSTPRRFEVTGLLTGDDVFELLSDNSYPGWPRGSIIASSAATDETQTNWNGVLGYIRLSVREKAFISSLRVYPRGGTLDVRWDIDGETREPLLLESDALDAPVTVDSAAGECVLSLRRDIRLWDEGEGNLYTLSARLGGNRAAVRFGVRDLGVKDGQFSLNGRKIFLRSEANCAVFPETGCEPQDAAEWRRVIGTYMSYGVNCLRFHSHCPPEAAFEAADELGMLMQPELSNWDPRDAFGDEVSREYYRAELYGILRAYANHPSLVMLALGNELQAGEEGHRFMAETLELARCLDGTRLYAPGSNNHYGRRKTEENADFYTSASYMGHPLRATGAGMTGWLNGGAPLDTDYREAMEAIRRDFAGPVVSFEVGQYEVLPDFDELEAFYGVTKPSNLELVRKKVGERGFDTRWREYVAASGELARLSYRAEVEAALATPGLGGISLLGLQDFPGQGTALVGMMNSHLEPKPYDFARPESFRKFFTGVLPLLRLDRRVFTSGERIDARVLMANYGKRDLAGIPEVRIRGTDIGVTLPAISVAAGELGELGTARLDLSGINAPAAADVEISFCGFENTYRIWVYPEDVPELPDTVHRLRELDDRAAEILAGGGRVLLTPSAPGNAVRGQFTTDFWSVGTFPQQSGAMGFYIKKDHPIFSRFPTDSHTDCQWRSLAGAYGLRVPEGIESVVALMDSYAYLRRLSCLFECRCGGGRLLVTTLGIDGEDAASRALRRAVYMYMDSEDFKPERETDIETIRAVLEGKER